MGLNHRAHEKRSRHRELLVRSTSSVQPFESPNWNPTLGDVENVEPEAQV